MGMSDRRTSERRTGDHDTIIEIKTKLDRLISDVADIKTNTTNRVEVLEASAAEWREAAKQLALSNADHEARIRRLEIWGFMALGAIGLVEIILKVYHK